MGSDAWYEEIEKRRAERSREEIAKIQAEGLMEQWEALKAAEIAQKQAEEFTCTQRGKYRDMLASALGVRIGTRVSVTKRHGCGPKAQMRTSIYEVSKIVVYGATALSLYGRTAKKDGSLGEVHNIGTDWKREVSDAQ